MTQSLNSAPQKQKFSVAINSKMYQNLIASTLRDPARARRFSAAITSAVAVNPALQECDAGTILAGALLGESLNLSPSPQLGQYYLVPFKQKAKYDRDGNMIRPETTTATFVLGYKGYIQLAIRSGQYKDLEAMEIKQGEYLGRDPETGKVKFQFIEDDDERENLPTIGYMAYFEYNPPKDGTLIPLTGNERFVFPGIRSQIDRDKAQWEQIDNVKTANGRKGGRPKKAETEKANGLDENLKNQQVISVSKKSLEKEKKKDKEKDKDNISSSTATAENDISACIQAYEQNIGPIARAAFDDISHQLADLPADLICEAIGEAALNNKRSWNYVKAILKRCREQNILSVDAYRAEKENHAAAAAARAAPAARPQSKQAAVRERLKKRLEEMGGAQSDDPADNRIYVEATELVAEPLPGE